VDLLQIPLNHLQAKPLRLFLRVNFRTISVHTELDLFDQLVLPILNYGSEIWGLTESMAIERVHLNFYKKKQLSITIQTKNNFVFWEIARTSLKTKRAIKVRRYWLKITSM
jgi:hypothetical protein